MELTRLADSDVWVSRVGLGCNNFGGRLDLEATRAVVDAALDEGVTFFDTANRYGNYGGSERFLGEILRGRRDRITLATKFGMDMGDGVTSRGRRAYVRGAIDGSLERLQMDHVDLYYLHEPDPTTPIAETLGALDELMREGKVRAIGCSNFSAEQLAEADRVAREQGSTRFVCVQNEYNLLYRVDDESVPPIVRELGLSYVPHSPLESGLLGGKYRRGEPSPAGTRLAGRAIDDAAYLRLEALERFASERGHTLLELAVSALASTPGMASVIAGATTPAQVRANAAAGGWQLSDADLEALRVLEQPVPARP
jgi:aryl-alcohol dehydrogenase-like predicted oxidoreductase